MSNLEYKIASKPKKHGVFSKNIFKRYASAEILSNVAAYVGSKVAYEITKDESIAAHASVWSGNIAYYGWMLKKNITNDINKTDNYGRRELFKTIAGTLGEFGIPGTIDAIFTRPYLTRMGTEILGRGPGVIVGRLAADIVFYTGVISMYKTVNKWKNR